MGTLVRLLLAAVVALAALGLAGRESTPALSADTAPFYRMGDPLIFQVSSTARQYPISPPKGATSYRLVNPCREDVRLRKVENLSEKITLTTGTRFLARTVEVVASSKPTYISVISHGDPGPAGCFVELQYGTGY